MSAIRLVAGMLAMLVANSVAFAADSPVPSPESDAKSAQSESAPAARPDAEPSQPAVAPPPATDSVKPASPPVAAKQDVAKPDAAPAAVPPAAKPPSVTVIDAFDAKGILGRDVRSPASENMGRIADVIVDRAGQVRGAVIDFGGFLGVGSRKIAVDWRVLKFTTEGKVGRLTLQLNRNQVRVSPEYKAGEPIVVLGATSPGAAVQAPEGDASAAAEKAAAPSDKAPDRPQEKTPDK